jgi:hypothetical protein
VEDMNFYEIGKEHGICQYGMDTLTGMKREGDLLAYTALHSTPSVFPNRELDAISLSQYVGGFMFGYIVERYEREVSHAS